MMFLKKGMYLKMFSTCHTVPVLVRCTIGKYNNSSTVAVLQI